VSVHNPLKHLEKFFAAMRKWGLTAMPQRVILRVSMPQSGKNDGKQDHREVTMVKKKVKQIQDEFSTSARQIWLAGLGALATGQETGNKIFKDLVKKGEALEEAGKEQVEKAKGTVSGVSVMAESYWETFEKKVDEKMTAVIHKLGVPTNSEIEALTKKVEDLTKTIEALQKKQAAPARKPAARKPAARKTAAAKKTEA